MQVPALRRINADGTMSWNTAQNWITSMNAANYLGVSTWRLPATPASDPTCVTQGTISSSCTGSEMGHLFYIDLGGVAGTAISQQHNSNYSLFSNLQDATDYGRYWSGTAYPPDPTSAWLLSFGQGGQTWDSKAQAHFAMALTTGDVAASSPTITYYFPHLALGGGWQTVLTYINYSPQTVTCMTNFYADSGAPLLVPFGGAAASSRNDALQPGQSLHDESTANLNAPAVTGWAQAVCNGSIKASLLFRLYQQGAPAGEAGVNAVTAPATKFVTFAQTKTGVAYANPSTTQPAGVTFTVISSAGVKLGSMNLNLPPGAHASANLGPLLGLENFVGIVEITSSVPIVTLSLNAEAFPVFSSLPPGI